jgi:hypothetical protein
MAQENPDDEETMPEGSIAAAEAAGRIPAHMVDRLAELAIPVPADQRLA